MSQEGLHVDAEAAFNILMFGRIQADQVARPHHVEDPDIRLGGNLVCFHLQMLFILVWWIMDSLSWQSKMNFCFVVESGYIQTWSIASFANFCLSVIIIMTIFKKLDKLHECYTITEVISHCVLQKLLPTISFKRLLSLEICSQTRKISTVEFNSGKSFNCRLYVQLKSENDTCIFQNLLY